MASGVRKRRMPNAISRWRNRGACGQRGLTMWSNCATTIMSRASGRTKRQQELAAARSLVADQRGLGLGAIGSERSSISASHGSGSRGS